jgi:putative flippase GtrA
MTVEKRQASSETLHSALRFVLVGVLGTMLDFSIFTLLLTSLGFPVWISNMISYSVGIINNFFFHRYWTFARRPRKALPVQFSQFVGISFSALVLNTLVVTQLTPTFSQLLQQSTYGSLLAKVLATGIGMIWNFFANHLWTFRAAPVEVGK